MLTRRPTAILTDIEGTTTRIAFVRDVLFTYARARLPGLATDSRAEVEAALAEVRRLVPEAAAPDTLAAWMDRDEKITPLKTLQGILWRDGYADGSLRGHLYADVALALRRWAAAGLRLSVYSSGSVLAQQLLFRHSDAGDLAGLFAAFHDTAIGAKRDAASYRAIALCAQLEPGRWLFLSDVAAELDAAASAGMQTCQLLRAEDGAVLARGHPSAADFDAVERLWGDG